MPKKTMDEFGRLWRMMDKCMDGEINFDALDREFDQQFARMEEEFFRDIFHTLRKTVQLCRQMECCQVPEILHITLCRAIEETPQKPPTQRKKPKTRRR